ncbi:MAG: integrin alpha [Patescibacteria group bacterium]
MKKKNQHLNPGLVLALSLIIILSGTFIYMNSTSDSSFLAFVKGDKKNEKGNVVQIKVPHDAESINDVQDINKMELPSVVKDMTDDELKELKERLVKKEYKINEKQNGVFEANNIKNDLKFKKDKDGVTVTANAGQALLSLEGIYKDESSKLLPNDEVAVQKNNLDIKFEYNEFSVKYENSPEGVRDIYTIGGEPIGDDTLKVELNIESDDFEYILEDNQIKFIDKNNAYAFAYSDLKAWDVNNQELESEMKLEEDKIIMEVNDADANYPITIDPILIRIDWSYGGMGGGYLGTSVSSAGDVNGDGFDDVIVGEPFYWNNYNLIDEGAAYVFHGSGAGLSIIEDWSGAGNEEFALFGTSVSSAGDVNGDGFDDVIVGAPYESGELQKGAAYIFHGSATGLSTTANWIGEGAIEEGEYGWSVSSAGDVNGDGYDDVIVGAPYDENGESEEGMAYVYYGSASGLSTTADWTTEGNEVGKFYGWSVSSAGDVNADGYDDVMVSKPRYENGEADEGAVYLYYGSASGLALVVGDILEPNEVGAEFGFSLSSGDVNNDGYSDVIIGAIGVHQGSDTGSAYIYNGSMSGISTTPNWLGVGQNDASRFGHGVASVDFNGNNYPLIIVGAEYDWKIWDDFLGRVFIYRNLNGTISANPKRGIWGRHILGYFGTSVSSAGDVDNDGYEEFLIGEKGINNGGTPGDGIVFLIKRRPPLVWGIENLEN